MITWSIVELNAVLSLCPFGKPDIVIKKLVVLLVLLDIPHIMVELSALSVVVHWHFLYRFCQSMKIIILKQVMNEILPILGLFLNEKQKK